MVCGKPLVSPQQKFCSGACKSKDFYDKTLGTSANGYYKQTVKGNSRKLMFIDERGGKCEICGYNKNMAALEFHHVNPNEKEFELDKRSLSNNSIQTLRNELEKCIVVCANCHREIHHKDSEMSLIRENLENERQILSEKVLDVNYVAPKKTCECCGKEITPKATMCVECTKFKQRKVERPSKELLELEIKEFSYIALGKKYGVANNTIKKWCKGYGII